MSLRFIIIGFPEPKAGWKPAPNTSQIALVHLKCGNERHNGFRLRICGDLVGCVILSVRLDWQRWSYSYYLYMCSIRVDLDWQDAFRLGQVANSKFFTVSKHRTVFTGLWVIAGFKIRGSYRFEQLRSICGLKNSIGNNGVRLCSGGTSDFCIFCAGALRLWFLITTHLRLICLRDAIHADFVMAYFGSKLFPVPDTNCKT